MDLTWPLTTVAPTLDALVLQVLAATTSPCTAAEVHRRADRGSDEGVRKVLARLVQQGVVLSETPARYPIYFLNRDHVASPYIEALARAREEILERIRSLLSGWKAQPLCAALFGSFARGEADADSDIDILVIRPGELEPPADDVWLKQVDSLDREVRKWTGNPAQVVDMSPAALARMTQLDDPLLDAWRAEAITVHGEQLMTLLRRLK